MSEEQPQSAAAAQTRKLAAIMFSDIVGFSRQMGADEARMLRLLDVHNQVIQQAVAAQRGTVIKIVGDAFLVDFPSVVHAVQCAQQIQAQFRSYNAEKEKTEQIHVRIGIHLGDVVQRDGDVFGDGVNIASRLQAFAEPDTVCISDMVYRDVAQKVPLGTVVLLGRPRLKNIAQRFPVYALLSESPTGLRQVLRIQRLKLSRRVGFAHRVAAVVLLLALASAGTLVIKNVYFPTPSPGQSQGVAPTGSQAALPLPDKPSIVVLPFNNLSGDPGQKYFSDGITEVLTSDLSRISSLFVIARNTAFTYDGKPVNVQEVGKELGVRYVLEGSVQKTTDQVRIVAQLIDTTTGGHLWSQRYDRPLQDIFALQDEIVQKIVTTLKLQLTLHEQGIVTHKTTDNLEAYDFYLRGFDQGFRVTPEANTQARQMLEQAIVLDPRYAEAYALLGFTYWQEWTMGWSQDPRTIERAGELARQALALDNTLPYTHMLLSSVLVVKNQPELALAAAERAIALDPNSADAYAWLARTLNFLERSPEAIRAMEQAMRLNPRYPFWYLLDLGWAYYQTGRYEEAIAAEKQALRHNPHYLFAASFLVTSYLEAWLAQQEQDPRTPERALEAAQQVIAVNASAAVAHIVLGWASVLNKQYAQAEAAIEQALALNSAIVSILPPLVTGILNYVGRPEEVLKLMEQALRLTPRPPARYFMQLGHAYYLTGRTEEAIEPLQKFLNVFPHRVDAHVLLAAAYSEVGREDEARAEVAAVLRLSPQYSLDMMQQRWPYQDPAQVERLLAALRKAGLE